MYNIILNEYKQSHSRETMDEPQAKKDRGEEESGNAEPEIVQDSPLLKLPAEVQRQVLSQVKDSTKDHASFAQVSWLTYGPYKADDLSTVKSIPSNTIKVFIFFRVTSSWW